jgi:hypothetical protein
MEKLVSQPHLRQTPREGVPLKQAYSSTRIEWARNDAVVISDNSKNRRTLLLAEQSRKAESIISVGQLLSNLNKRDIFKRNFCLSGTLYFASLPLLHTNYDG